MSDQFINSLAQDLKPVQPLASPIRREMGLWFISTSIVILGVIYWFLSKDEYHIPAGRSLVEMILLLLAAKISGALCIRSTSPHFAEPRLKWWSWALLLSWSTLLLGAFTLAYFRNTEEATIALKYQTWLCPQLTYSIALPLGAILFFYLRQGYVLYPKTTAMYLAQTIFVFGVIGLSFICPWDDPLHELLYHVLPVVVGAVTFGYLLKLFLSKKIQ
ncbi:MAG: NrsF family protein [Bdellovibrionales bacterium]|nr:NrsF family protein [Bdellovibrionales bacterium]